MTQAESEFWQNYNDIHIHTHFIGSLKPDDAYIIDELRRKGKASVERERKEARKRRKLHERH
jgi:hypothetical protein